MGELIKVTLSSKENIMQDIEKAAEEFDKAGLIQIMTIRATWSSTTIRILREVYNNLRVNIELRDNELDTGLIFNKIAKELEVNGIKSLGIENRLEDWCDNCIEVPNVDNQCEDVVTLKVNIDGNDIGELNLNKLIENSRTDVEVFMQVGADRVIANAVTNSCNYTLISGWQGSVNIGTLDISNRDMRVLYMEDLDIDKCIMNNCKIPNINMLERKLIKLTRINEVDIRKLNNTQEVHSRSNSVNGVKERAYKSEKRTIIIADEESYKQFESAEEGIFVVKDINKEQLQKAEERARKLGADMFKFIVIHEV